MGKLIFRVHAVQRMFERGISREDVASVLETGEIIREYEDDKPFPSRLVLGWRNERPLHVVAADDDNDQTIVITAYEPDSAIWQAGFKKKKDRE